MKNIFTTIALILCTSYLSKAQDQVYLELPQGWSMFGYVSTEDTDVIEAFSEISNDIEIVKDGWGMAYIPDWGFNGLGNLEYARGYQIKMINQVDDFQFESVIASSMDNNEALIALEELLFNLQENMTLLQDEAMFNHMNQEDLITTLQIDLQASQDIEWQNHYMQDDQIMDLHNYMMSMHTYLDEQNMMQDDQIMMLQSVNTTQDDQIMELQNDMTTMNVYDDGQPILYQIEQWVEQNNAYQDQSRYENHLEIMELQNDMTTMNVYDDGQPILYQMEQWVEQNNAYQDQSRYENHLEMMELNAYQAQQIMILQEEVETLQTVLSQLATLCEDLQSQINQE